MKFGLPYCEECGASRVPHHIDKLPDILENLIRRSGVTGTLFDRFDAAVTHYSDRLWTPERILSWARALLWVGVVTIRDTPHNTDTTRTLALYEGARATGVTLYTIVLFGAPVGFVAEKEDAVGIRRVAFRVIPRPDGPPAESLSWMDDKGELKEHLERHGLPCAEGGVARTEEEAVALFQKIGRPVITKPYHGSRGRHTSLDLRTEEEVRRGFNIAKQLATRVVVEAYLHGTIHRVTLVGGTPVAIAKREYPHVIGDGVHTIDELIDIENTNPMRDGVFYKKLDKEHRMDTMLKKQNLTRTSVPAHGVIVMINDKNSRLHGTVTEDVTDTVHIDNIALFTRIAGVLNDPIVGVDFMIEDMARPWSEQPDAGVIECNSMPFIDVHHKVVSGRTINVAAHLWNTVFP